MLKPLQLAGQWVLVTGASSGLGKAFAEELARRHGSRLILTARRRDRLEHLASELQARYATETLIIEADLSKSDELERLFNEVVQKPVYAVILSAGTTYYGKHLEMPEETLEVLLATNISSLVYLTDMFLKYFQEQPSGGALMLVASVAGLLPVPYQAAYAGSKGFVISYGLALAEELSSDRLSLTICAPGGIATEMLVKAGLDKKFKARHPGLMSAERCAELALGAFVSRKRFYVPGLLNKANLLAARVLPRRFVLRMAEKLYRPSS